MAANLGFGCAQKAFSKSGNVILKLKLLPYCLLSKYNPKIYHFSCYQQRAQVQSLLFSLNDEYLLLTYRGECALLPCQGLMLDI